jgi:hypothetical protein
MGTVADMERFAVEMYSITCGPVMGYITKVKDGYAIRYGWNNHYMGGDFLPSASQRLVFQQLFDAQHTPHVINIAVATKIASEAVRGIVRMAMRKLSHGVVSQKGGPASFTALEFVGRKQYALMLTDGDIEQITEMEISE